MTMADDLYQEMVQFLQSIGQNVLPQNLEKVCEVFDKKLFVESFCGKKRRMLKAPPLISLNLHFLVLQCNCRSEISKAELCNVGGK